MITADVSLKHIIAVINRAVPSTDLRDSNSLNCDGVIGEPFSPVLLALFDSFCSQISLPA